MMNTSEINNLVRHRIVSVIIRINGTSYGDDKSFRKIPQKLKNTIENQALSGRMAVKQLAHETPGLLVFIFMRHLPNVQFISTLKEMFPSLIFDWKTEDNVTIYVDTNEKGSSYLSPKCIMKPLCQFILSKVLFESTKNLMALFDNVANSTDTAKKLESLKSSILGIASRIVTEKVEIHIFGSRMTGLTDWKTDVDVYLQISDTFCTGIEYKFHQAMKGQPNVYSDMTPILGSTFIAILRFRHIESDLECDLNFKSGMSTTNSKLVKTYLQIDPRVKYVICGVRFWMQKTELKVSFLSCAQTWMVLFFLMKRNVVPTIEVLRNMMPANERSFIIDDGWNCAFPDIADIKWSSSCATSREELLKDFFAFYGNNASRLQSHVLCPFNGEMKDKMNFMNECKLKYSSTQFGNIMRDFRGPICILDPFVYTKNLNRFTQYCEKAYCTFVEYCKETSVMNL